MKLIFNDDCCDNEREHGVHIEIEEYNGEKIYVAYCDKCWEEKYGKYKGK